MQLPAISVILSGLLLIGTSLGDTQSPISERAICSGQKCDSSPNSIPASGKPANSPSPLVKDKGINCAFLLENDSVDCTGLHRKTCDLVGWLHAGCKMVAIWQSKCAKSSGAEAKKCCDDAERLPFGGGVYYTGYLRACAPQYQIKRFDRPDFIDRPCSADYRCGLDMNKRLCDMRDWEKAGCQQRAKCDAKIKDVSELPQCCKEWSKKPQTAMANTTAQDKSQLPKAALVNDGWDIRPIENPATAPWNKKVSQSDLKRMTEGFVPETMEDKWLCYSDLADAQGTVVVHLCRSWSRAEQITFKLEPVDTVPGVVARITEITWETQSGESDLGEEEAKENAIMTCNDILDCTLEMDEVC
ncbi:hypothetical protein F53441_2484 [Fusarium austroafricanum]|uniref:Uncharacterized protein n=1 Tax=Fusarium austroafricanum TaxID=2364996 RepID=A0A8H4KSV6_9HYPO|nr:hypothetical protein F53441_2484 [Fusarium austroafricanum]